jgi:hypothetical protein
MLAMTVFPEVLKAGQEELDRVVGKDRLPTFDDEERLPYIRAMVKETLRWRPVAVLGGTVLPPNPSSISSFNKSSHCFSRMETSQMTITRDISSPKEPPS